MSAKTVEGVKMSKSSENWRIVKNSLDRAASKKQLAEIENTNEH